MNLRPFAYIAMGALLGMIGLGWWTATHPRSDTAGFRPASRPMATAMTARVPGRDLAMAAVAPPIPPDLPPPPPQIRPSPEALKDMDDIQFMLRDFRTRLGENPVGTNAEIMKNLMGGNPVQAKLGPPEGQNLNEEGELVDRWGTAYFFHQISKNEMEIRSAGPDRTMYTADDVVVR